MKDMRNRAFTLVEMLIVVLIIGVLTGITFKLYGMATRNAMKAKTIGILEQLGFALEEYRAEYGMYPPCGSVDFKYGPQQTTDPFLKRLLANPQDWPEGVDLINYKYGLVAHLWPRGGFGVIYTAPGSGWIADTDRDKAAKARWAKYLPSLSDWLTSGNAMSTGTSNLFTDIRDGWGSQIHYGSSPPYQTYELWSDGNGQPLHKNKWDN
jgi:prepilin-type N-terminal cleavage/methylation domain-containing protein